MSRRSEGIDPGKRGGDMSNTIRWLVGIGCATGLLVSIWITRRSIGFASWVVLQPMEFAIELLLILGGPLGYLLVGWICARHWKTVSRQQAVLVGAIALVGTWLTVALWAVPFPLSTTVLFVGIWMLNGSALAWLLRKRRRIMQEANAE